jgi:hypothetical protein
MAYGAALYLSTTSAAAAGARRTMSLASIMVETQYAMAEKRTTKDRVSV